MPPFYYVSTICADDSLSDRGIALASREPMFSHIIPKLKLSCGVKGEGQRPAVQIQKVLKSANNRVSVAAWESTEAH